MKHARRGVTMAIAIALLAFTGVALVAVARLVRDDARRTLDERTDAQLRSLLLAGMTDAQSRLQAEGALAKQATLALPAELADAALRSEASEEHGEWRVAITASRELRELRTECVLRRDASGEWRVRETMLHDVAVLGH